MKKTVITAAIAALFISNNAQAAKMKRVTFESQGQTLVGSLYLPENYQQGQKLPAMVVTGSWTSVKEQMPAGYAKMAADRGFAALAFDFRGWGESGGKIKYLEDPKRKTQDIIAAVNFLANIPEVDPGKIAGLGICASAGYMADAALESDKIKSVALVAPWLHDAKIVDAVYGGQKGVNGLITTSRKAQATYKQTGKMTSVPAASLEDKTAVMFKAPYYTEKNRGLIPEYDNKFNLMTWEPWLTYDAIQTADKLKKPTLLVHSEAAAIPQGAKEFAKRMGDKATTVWLENVTQFDFYDKPQAMNEALKSVQQHFQETLK